jgi:peptidoglycan-associated lipoprotein
MNRVLISALLVGLLSACASTPVPSTQPSASSAVKPVAANSAPVVPSKEQLSNLPPYKDPKNILSQKRSVFFALDQYLINGEYRSLVEAHAKYLAGNPSQKIRIEGNTDEQGSREYNLALGQKRAQAVMTAMTLLGVKENQIEAVSWGKEKPKAEGHDESAWAQNRRADIKYGDEK